MNRRARAWVHIVAAFVVIVLVSMLVLVARDRSDVVAALNASAADLNRAAGRIAGLNRTAADTERYIDELEQRIDDARAGYKQLEQRYTELEEGIERERVYYKTLAESTAAIGSGTGRAVDLNRECADLIGDCIEILTGRTTK